MADPGAPGAPMAPSDALLSAAETGNVSETIALLPAVPDADQRYISMIYATMGHHADVVAVFLNAGVPTHAPVDSQWWDCFAFPLNMAAMYGDLPTMDVVLAAGADPNRLDSTGREPLRMVGSAAAVHRLVAGGADPTDPSDPNAFSIAYWLALHDLGGQLEALLSYRSRGIDVTRGLKGRGDTVLHAVNLCPYDSWQRMYGPMPMTGDQPCAVDPWDVPPPPLPPVDIFSF